VDEASEHAVTPDTLSRTTTLSDPKTGLRLAVADSESGAGDARLVMEVSLDSMDIVGAVEERMPRKARRLQRSARPGGTVSTDALLLARFAKR
jgi:hypothetical protein